VAGIDGRLVAAALAGAFAAGAGLGLLAEKVAVGRAFRPDPERDEPFGSLHGPAVPLRADDGTLLHVEVDEPPPGRGDDGLTIVFSHGYALNEDSWHYQRRDLQGLGRLVFWDQRSHGASARSSGGHDIDTLGRDLAAVIAAVAPTGPLVLVGHSMGGMTVMALAHQQPELFGTRVQGVALVATSAGGIGEVSLGLPGPAAKIFHAYAPGAAASLARQKEFVERQRERGNDLGLLLTRLYSFGSAVPASMNAFTAEMLAATPIDVIADFLPTFETHDKHDALAVLNDVEVLVVVGSSDLLTPEEHSRDIVRIVPGAELLVLAETGHMVMLERYAEVNQALRELVGRVRRNLAAAAASGTPAAGAARA
jgi:pimeloyl-ACP methyl ester carboxylesterase